jgi:hypothetical protein
LVDEFILVHVKNFTGEILKDTIENATETLLGQMIIKLYFTPDKTKRPCVPIRFRHKIGTATEK